MSKKELNHFHNNLNSAVIDGRDFIEEDFKNSLRYIEYDINLLKKLVNSSIITEEEKRKVQNVLKYLEKTKADAVAFKENMLNQYKEHRKDLDIIAKLESKIDKMYAEKIPKCKECGQRLC